MAFSSFLQSPQIVLILAVVVSVSIFPVYGQVSSPCTASMITSVSPCMNFLTNSSSNGTSPTSDCCNSLKSLTSGGMDCLCQIVTGSVPFQVPINRTLAISLPRTCNMGGVPVQCKASVAPASAPGAPTFSPVGSPAATVVPEPTPAAEAPVSDTTPTTTEAPTATSGSRPSLTPSAAVSSYSFSPDFVLVAAGFVALKNYY